MNEPSKIGFMLGYSPRDAEEMSPSDATNFVAVGFKGWVI